MQSSQGPPYKIVNRYIETNLKKKLYFGETLFLPAEIELIKLKGKKTKIIHIHM